MLLLMGLSPVVASADSDGDAIPDSIDNCPSVPNGSQRDTDEDGVGDACDNCSFWSNPRVLPAPPDRRTTGGQVDDDLDGVGNLCDADFTEAEGDRWVNAGDLLKMLEVLGRRVTDHDCPGDSEDSVDSCARYDLDVMGEFIDVDDVLVMLGDELLGRSVLDQGCAEDDGGLVRCPLACESGEGGGPCLFGSMRALPARIAACGDSITQAFGADCTCNTNIFCLLCLLAGDQPEHSWFDGWDGDVLSVHDRYRQFDGGIAADKSSAEDGSRMLGGSNSFSAQAAEILARVPLPEHVAVGLGGNDLCSRECVSPDRCSHPMFTDAQWTAAVQAGLDQLVAGLPEGSTVYLLGVPRIQDLRQAGLERQSRDSGVDCEGVWQDFDICLIGTQAEDLNGESLSTRLAAISERQQRYNELLREEADAYNRNTNGRNPRGIEVITDYVDESTLSVGTYRFGPDDIDGGDCFHPSIGGQNLIAGLAWMANPQQ
jgi:lysophospholipase L1-like esterase